MDAKFQAILPHADPAADGEGATAALGALALSKQRRPQRQNAFAHFKKVPLLPPKLLLSYGQAMSGPLTAMLTCAGLLHSCRQPALHADPAEALCRSSKQAQCSIMALKACGMAWQAS